MVGAFLARGLHGLQAAAHAAHLHGRAAGFGPPVGLMAGDLPDLIPLAIFDGRRIDVESAPTGPGA
jgi:NAD(P)H-hydrate repair Nnr-like enzyme with NAD(P)H-hydrate dehydratase domain